MAGPGFEPGKAEPCGLQPHPFDRSGISPEVLGRQLKRRFSGLILDEIPQLGVVLLADRLLERDRLLSHPQYVADLPHRRLELTSDLVRGGFASELLDQLTLDVHDLVEL